MFYWFSGSILSSQDNLLLICGGYYPDSSQYSTYFTFYWLTHFVLSIQDNLLLTCGGTTPTVLNIWRTLLFIDLLILYCLSMKAYYWLVVVLPWQLPIFEVRTFHLFTDFILSIQDNLLFTCSGTTMAVLYFGRILLFIDLLNLFWLSNTTCYWVVVVLP